MVEIIQLKQSQNFCAYPEILRLISGENRWVDGMLKQVAYNRLPRGFEYNSESKILKVDASIVHYEHIYSFLLNLSLQTRLDERLYKPKSVPGNENIWSTIRKKKTRLMLLEDYVFRTHPDASTSDRKEIMADLASKLAGKDSGVFVVEMSDGIITNISHQINV